jgi:hypothetical protein
VLLETFLDLARLLARMDMQDELLTLRVAADLLQPVGRARADGMGGDADPRAVACAQGLHLLEIGGDRLLAEAVQPAATRVTPASSAASMEASASARPM